MEETNSEATSEKKIADNDVTAEASQKGKKDRSKAVRRLSIVALIVACIGWVLILTVQPFVPRFSLYALNRMVIPVSLTFAVLFIPALALSFRCAKRSGIIFLVGAALLFVYLLIYAYTVSIYF